MCKYTYFLLTRFCCLVFVRRFSWHAPGDPLLVDRSWWTAPGGHLLVGRSWWAAPGGPLLVGRSARSYLAGGGTTARAKFFCGVSTTARAGPCCPGPLTGRVFGENAPDSFQKSPSGRKSGTNAPDAPQHEPRRAHFRLNRARNSRAKAGTSTLSPESCAKLGVRGRNEHTFAQNARGERIARQCPAAGPEMRVDGPASGASHCSRSRREAKAWQISAWKLASKVVGGGCFQKGLHNSQILDGQLFIRHSQWRMLYHP